MKPDNKIGLFAEAQRKMWVAWIAAHVFAVRLLSPSVLCRKRLEPVPHRFFELFFIKIKWTGEHHGKAPEARRICGVTFAPFQQAFMYRDIIPAAGQLPCSLYLKIARGHSRLGAHTREIPLVDMIEQRSGQCIAAKVAWAPIDGLRMRHI